MFVSGFATLESVKNERFAVRSGGKIEGRIAPVEHNMRTLSRQSPYFSEDPLPLGEAIPCYAYHNFKPIQSIPSGLPFSATRNYIPIY